MKDKLTREQMEAFIKFDQTFWYAMHIRQRKTVMSIIAQMLVIGAGFSLQIMGYIPWWFQLAIVLSSALFSHVYYRHYANVADDIFHKAKDNFEKEMEET